MLSTADYLQIDEVKEFCFEFLERILTAENFLEIVKISSLYNNPPALQLTYQYICEHFSEIVQEKYFLCLSKTDLNSLFSKLDQKRVQEISIYKAILRWVQHDDTRKSDFPKLFEKIDLHKLPSDFVTDEVVEETLVQNNLNCSKAVMLYFASKAKSLKKINDSEECRIKLILNNTITKQSKIIRIGGKKSKYVKEVYNIFGKSAVVYPDLPTTLSGYCSVKVKDFIFCIGGWNDCEPTSKMYRMNLNETKLQWKEVASMVEKRSYFGAAAYNGSIVVTGGQKLWSALSSVELYNVQANKWRKISSMKHRRSNHAVVAIGKTLFAIGGHDSKTVQRLTGLNGEWKDVQPMNCSREGLASVYCNGFIYAIGGDNEHDGHSVEKYDLANDQWMFVSSLNEGRYNHGACVLNDKIYVGGGRKNILGDAVKTMECYNSSVDQWKVIEEADADDNVWHSLIAL